MTTIIPPMTHRLSSGWDQPPVEDIWFLDDLAVKIDQDHSGAALAGQPPRLETDPARTAGDQYDLPPQVQ